LPDTPPIPAEAAHLLAVLREPRRLAILLALEREPRNVLDVSRELRFTYSETHWAIRKLKEGNLVVLISGDAVPRKGRGADLSLVYETRHKGWDKLVRALMAIGASAGDGP
jgi:DNA-binding transcriptional ArsR family regulator